MKNNKKDFCTFEVAKLLKDIGFNEPVYFYIDSYEDVCNRLDFTGNGNVKLKQSDCRENEYLAPTQSQAQKFLFSKGYLVSARHFTQNWYSWLIQPFTLGDMGERIWSEEKESGSDSTGSNSSSIYNALEEGIKQTILLIKTK